MELYSTKENLQFLVDTHPYHKSLNEKIIRESKGLEWKREYYNADGGLTNVRAPQTTPYLFTPNVRILQDYIRGLTELNLAFTPHIQIVNCWIANYGRGDYAKKHHHGASWFSFVYFIRTPKGSSPLVFTTSGRRIKAEEGKVVIFPGTVRHSVPLNKCEGRMCMAGNIDFVDPMKMHEKDI